MCIHDSRVITIPIYIRMLVEKDTRKCEYIELDIFQVYDN